MLMSLRDNDVDAYQIIPSPKSSLEDRSDDSKLSADSTKLMVHKGLATKRQKILMMMKLCQNMKKIDSGAFVEIKNFWQPLV